MRLRSNSNKAPTKIVLLSFTKFRQIVSCYVFVLRLEQHIVFAISLMAGIFSSSHLSMEMVAKKAMEEELLGKKLWSSIPQAIFAPSLAWTSNEQR